MITSTNSSPTVAILCGGRGSRLGSLTDHAPKAMIPVAGKPFLEHQLAALHQQGIFQVVLCTGYLAEKIVPWIATWEAKYELKIRVSYDGPQSLGTAGALRKALPLLSDPFFVLYGDSYLDISYRWVYTSFLGIPPDKRHGWGLLTVVEAGARRPNVRADAGMVRVYNKRTPDPTLHAMDYGLAVLSHAALRQTTWADLGDVYAVLAADGQLAAYQTAAPLHEIGSLDGLAALRRELTADFITTYLQETREIALHLDKGDAIRQAVELLDRLRLRHGRLFILGNGGSAANASHAVNDFRKINGIEAYAPTDNVAELTARTNDDGWETTFLSWLGVSRLSSNDLLLILSVGGGTPTTSPNLCAAIDKARARNCPILSIVSRDGGYAACHSDVTIHIPMWGEDRITPHAEEFQTVLLHLLSAALGGPS